MKKTIFIILILSFAITIFANPTKNNEWYASQQIDNAMNYLYYVGGETISVYSVYSHSPGIDSIVVNTDSMVIDLTNTNNILNNMNDTTLLKINESIDTGNSYLLYMIDTSFVLLQSTQDYIKDTGLVLINTNIDTNNLYLKLLNDYNDDTLTTKINYIIDTSIINIITELQNIDTNIKNYSDTTNVLLQYIIDTSLVDINNNIDTSNAYLKSIQENQDTTILHIDTVATSINNLKSVVDEINDTNIFVRIFDNVEFVYGTVGSDSKPIAINKISETIIYKGDTYIQTINYVSSSDDSNGKIESIIYTK